MFISEGNVKIELNFFECWDIGNAILQGITKDSDVSHWGRLSYNDFLSHRGEEIKMARQFCNFSNPEWVDQKLAEFKQKINKENK